MIGGSAFLLQHKVSTEYSNYAFRRLPIPVGWILFHWTQLEVTSTAVGMNGAEAREGSTLYLSHLSHLHLISSHLISSFSVDEASLYPPFPIS